MYKIDERTKKRTIIANIKVEQPSYLHSFALTENYIVITEVPLRVKPYDLLLSKKSFIHEKFLKNAPTYQFIRLKRQQFTLQIT